MTATDLVRVRRMSKLGVARTIRQEAGLSLAEIAESVGVHRTTIFRWEIGEREPRGHGALRYLKVLDELSGR